MSIHFKVRHLPLLVPAPLAVLLLFGLSLGGATVALSADSAAATITSPTGCDPNKQTDQTCLLTSTLVEFKWDKGTNVKQYWLYVGTAKGEKDIYHENQKNNTSAYVSGLPYDGSPIYVRLWSHVENGWDYNDYAYKTCSKCGHSDKIAQLTSPDLGKPLPSTRVTFTWKQGSVAASQFWLTIGKSPGGRQYYNQNEKMNMTDTVGRLPNDGSKVYVRLWSLIADSWLYNDYVFDSCANCVADGVPAAMISPPDKSTLKSSVVTFEWDAGVGVTLYRLSISNVKAGGLDIYDKIEGQRHSDTVTGIPNDGSDIYVRLWSKISESWLYKDYTYTTCKGCVDRAEMISPHPGEMLPGSRVTFTWDAGAGMARYKLMVGKTLGGAEYYSAETPALHRTVSDLPTDGSVVYVRLGSLPRTSSPSPSTDSVLQENADWQYVDYLYIAYLGSADIAELTSPEPGSRLGGTSVTFAWDKGENVDAYWLWIGTKFGGKDLADIQTNDNSKAVTGLPQGDVPIFVRLWSLVDDTWRFNDYVYLAAPK